VRTRASKSSTSVKVVILPLLASLSWKRLQIDMGMLHITTSTSDELFCRINSDDFERFWTSEIRGFIDCCDLQLWCTLEEWIVMKWLEILKQFANRNCYRLSRISWALAQISCFLVVFRTILTTVSIEMCHSILIWSILQHYNCWFQAC